jgi:anti-sigma factor RsiW
MASCREVESLVTPYIDGEATAAEQAVVDAHLQECAPCRHLAALETATRDTVRARLCRPCAPEKLRARCLAAAAQTGARRLRTSPLSLTSMSMVAALALLLGGVLMYSLTGWSPTVLAAQLTLDHVTCFAVHNSDTPVDTRASEQRFASDHGWQIRLPEAAANGLQLVGVRRCYCGEGPAAHVMYRLDGRPVSLYIIPDVNRSRASTDVFGHDAVIWSKQGTTYVLLGRESGAMLEQLASRLNESL